METTTDTRSTRTPFHRANSQLQNTVFQHSHHHLPGCMDELIETLFISWCDRCAPPSVMSFTTLSPLLKHTIRCLTVLTSTGLSPSTFSKCQWMSMGAIFCTWSNSGPHLCFMHTFMSDTIFSGCLSAAICPTATKLNVVLSGGFNLSYRATNIFLWCHGPT